MADQKLTQLTETTDIANDDILYTVRDPATVPLSRKIKWSNVVPVATETIPGKVELSTTDEARAGTDTTRAVTPAGLVAGISNHFGGELLDSTSPSGASSVTFSAIPQTHNHLVLRGYGLYTTSDAADMRITLNSSSDGYYWGQWGISTATGFISSYASSTDFFVIVQLNPGSTDLANFEITFYNYSATGRKGYSGSANNGVSTQLIAIGGLWIGAASPVPAITSITISLSVADTFSGNFYLYGFDG